MRAIVPGLLLLLAIPVPAHAMNWEGHDDWMADMEPAVIYEKTAPHAVQRPQGRCAVNHDKAKDNPYEQIPLHRHACPESPAKPEAER